MRIVLASGSPRRRELLTQIGLEYEVIVSNAEENAACTEPAKLVEELSYIKAKAVADEHNLKDVIIIGADTVVASGDKILGKPDGEEGAFAMLKALSGKVHEVYTGVTLLKITDKVERITFNECTKVKFYEMSDDEIRGYIATKDPLDKAGAYGIQGFCARYISGIEGDYNNVVGLPIGRLYQEIKEVL